MNNVYAIIIFALLFTGGQIESAYAQQKTPPQKFSAYLFTYFTGNSKSEEAIHFALSNDGYHYQHEREIPVRQNQRPAAF
jgi:type I site-specific restriction-modification system R (restriction) subunit